jgi:hypothetical protein
MSGSLAGRIISGVLVLVLALGPVAPARAQNSAGGAPNGALQAFLLTSTYGVLAGTLTGLASLAFYGEPGEHGRNVAMGASLGLYVGLLLGAYLVYAPSLAAPSTDSESDEPEVDDADPMNLGVLPSWDPVKSTMQLGLVYKF